MEFQTNIGINLTCSKEKNNVFSSPTSHPLRLVFSFYYINFIVPFSLPSLQLGFMFSIITVYSLHTLDFGLCPCFVCFIFQMFLFLYFSNVVPRAWTCKNNQEIRSSVKVKSLFNYELIQFLYPSNTEDGVGDTMRHSGATHLLGVEQGAAFGGLQVS